MDAPPGEQIEVFSFDHDLAEFVAVGLATVTEDGSQICSDPGFGIVKSGWGGCVPPPPPCAPVANCQTNNQCAEKRKERRGRCDIVCVPVNTDGRACNDMNECTLSDVCEGNSCRGEPISLNSVDATANMSQELEVTLGEAVKFRATVEENCANLDFEWDFGDGNSSAAQNPDPHVYRETGEFRVSLTVTCGACGVRKDFVDVVVASKDVVVVAWVDPAPINLEALAADANLLLRCDLGFCNLLIVDWTTGFRKFIFSEGDRRYANAFLLKNSPNERPPTTIDPDALRNGGDFRLFNRFRVLVDESGESFKVLQSAATVGKTPDPCTGIVLPLLSNPEVHPSNGTRGLTDSGNRIFQLNEGRLGTLGQIVDLTLNDCDAFLGQCTNILSDVGKTTPWIWSVISFDGQGNREPIDHQIFPTYFVYEDDELVEQFAQSEAESFIGLDETSQREP